MVIKEYQVNNVNSLALKNTQLETISTNLQKLLEAHGVSESDIAQSLGIPVMTIRRLVSGETADPRISTLKLLADFFEVSIDSLTSNTNVPIPTMANLTPKFIPLLDWPTLSSTNQWHPLTLPDPLSLSENAFALESRPSMQPRFPKGTLLIIDPDASITDGDMVLVKILRSGDLSLRELIIDPPKWQLQPVVMGSEILFYDPEQHDLLGVVSLTLLHIKK
jgi:transcriptional regulator with XRE-family HTH domain